MPPVVVGRSESEAVARLRRITVLSLVLPALLFVVVCAVLYQRQFVDAGKTLESHSRILQEHALKMLDTNEMVLQRMLDLVGDEPDSQVLARSERLHHRLRAMAAPLPQVQGLFINGADAHPLVNSLVHPARRELDYSDRAWFKAHRDGKISVASELLVSRLLGELAFDLSRRRTLPDGSFGGTVHVSLRPAYLIDFYRELGAANPNLRMALLRQDGQYLARWPGELKVGLKLPPELLAGALGNGSTNGYQQAQWALDGYLLMVGLRKLGGYPLYASVAVDRADVLAAWFRQVGLIALFLVPTSIAFAAMAWSALQRTHREFEAMKRLEEEMAHRLRIETTLQTTRKLEAMGRLTGGVAHDFNNLLMIMSTSLYLLKRRNPHLPDDTQLAPLERAIASGTKLTRQLLSFARKQALQTERIDLATRLPSLLGLLHPVVGSGIDLSCDVAPDAGAIEVDAAELELAMINLAANARDAMQGEGRLVINARNADAAERPAGIHGELVLIEVIDTGSGIDLTHQAQLFQPFFTTKPVGQGTGLGLSQVRNLCEGAGGTATIDNAPGLGARVRLFFARSHIEAPIQDHAAQPSERLDCRVLLVEDNNAVGEATAGLLQAMGCLVARASSAAAALDYLDSGANEPVDIVLSDIEMPGSRDGISLADELMKREPSVPVVLMTGYTARMEQAVALGIEVLPKPCSPQALAAAIEKALVPAHPA
jgi:signal transduction histidine kinase/ActR/RegA family two-component response regulator